MTPLDRAIALAILSAMILVTALATCAYRQDNSITVPRGTFERMLGQGSPDTNFVSRMEFTAAKLEREREILMNSNNWAAMRGFLQQIDQRMKDFESRPFTAIIDGSKISAPTNHWPPTNAPAPLQSAPQVPPIEKVKP